MKSLFLLLAIVIVVSCNNGGRNIGERNLEGEWKNHLAPRDSIVNLIKTGKTFALESSETRGVDHERFKKFDYWKEIDKGYFEYITSKSFSNPGEDGGTETTLEIYKAIRPGETEVRFYKRNYYGNRDPSDSSNVKDTAAILYNAFKFRIE